MGQQKNTQLKAYVRFDGTGRIVPSSLILQRFKPKDGNWQEIDATECCGYVPSTTTTTSSSTSTSTTTSTSTSTTTSTSTSTTTTTTTTSGPTSYTVEYSDGDVCTSVSGTRTLEGDASSFCDCTVFTNTTSSMNTIKFGTNVLTIVPRNPVDPNIADVVGSCTTC